MVAACARSSAPDAPAPNIVKAENAVEAPPAGAHQAAFAALTDRCGLPHTALQLQGNELWLQFPPDAGPEAIECMLREIRASGLDAHMTMGFVGNERLLDDNITEGARR
jgi:hypothetical protein